MQTLIYKKPIFRFSPQFSYPNVFTLKSHHFVVIRPKKFHPNHRPLTLCCTASPQSLSYGGWDSFQSMDDSVHSGKSNLFHNLMNSLGIGDKKYAFVYLFGFVCALAISRIRVSSIVVIPACAIVFALGFSGGFARGIQLKELRLNGSRKKPIDEILRGSIEKFRNLGDNLGEYNTKLFNLKNDITKNIECNQVTVSDLEGYLDVIESANSSSHKSMNAVEICIQCMFSGNQDKVGSSDKELGRQSKKFGENRFNLPQYIGGFFGQKVDSSFNMMESMGVEKTDRKLDNILTPSVKSGNLGEKNTVGARKRAEIFVDGTDEKDAVETNDSLDSHFDQSTFNYQNKASRIVSDQHVDLKDYQDEMEATASRTDAYDSVDFSIRMNRTKTETSSGRKRRQQIQNRNYSFLEEDQLEFQNFSYSKRAHSEKENIFCSSSVSSILNSDLEFSRYLAEAKNLLKEAKGCFSHQVDEDTAEHALYKSEILLSKAIDMRPVSLLAVGQLGNTYLLHGELKLRKSRQLRSQLVRTGALPVEDMGKARNRFNDPLANKDKIVSALMNICEECEELLIKAGRTYKMALSIDGNDIRALYNWGLALSFRAQLISDIGPSGARDADKVFMAAIDKFDAMMSRSNDYAPDALYRWGAALQHRSRLRPSHSREKVKLLQQARQLYEDALGMDSRNPQLQKALSSCISELDKWRA